MKICDAQYFTETDTLQLARQLLGKVLCTAFDGEVTSGRIVETEAYLGVTDRASHAWGGRHTARTKTMYLQGGHAYVYLCYGIHHMFNIVTQPENNPHAILVRAIQPLEGIERMMQRRKKTIQDYSLTRGPGSLSQALGINTRQTGSLLTPPELFIYDDGWIYTQSEIGTGPRIGVDYAAEDALLPYRYYIKNNPWVSKPNA